VNGWIDLQINGWGGVDFADPGLDASAAQRACVAIRATGTAGFLATLITSPASVYARNLPLLAALDDPGLLGLHLEGPFFHPEGGALGVHAPALCRPADPDLLAHWQDLARGRIRLITLGADLPGAPALTAAARRLGIAVSLGHHMADARQLAACADAGATALTHLGNGVPLRIDRHDNPIWAGLAETRLAVMVIADGHHLPSAVLRSFALAAGDRLVLVSDASPIAGCGPGSYRCFGRDVLLSPAGRLEDCASGGFAGSAASLADCVAVARRLGLSHVNDAANRRALALIGSPVDCGC
jgi:N-acetylglucosamine-6-phosphate deacetylase